MRIGLVGAGFAARFHLSAWRRVHGVPIEVVGVTSRSAEKRNTFASTHALRAFDTFDGMLSHADVIDVCTPGATHETFTVAALKAGKEVVLEKPFTGYYGGSAPPARTTVGAGSAAGAMKSAPVFHLDAGVLEQVMASCRRIREAALAARRFICYAENWVYAPAIQKERDILEKSGAQVLRMLGEESHSGSHAPSYGFWAQAGGGALAGKGCHPLSAALYFKFVEGQRRNRRPILPVVVNGSVHRLTQIPSYENAGFIRTDYHDTEDYGQMHITFDDGTVADILASDVVLGGVSNWIEVFANNHRTRCMLNPIDALETFSPGADTLRDVYIAEKLAPKQGWMRPAPDEDWMHGYPQEIQAFAEAIAQRRVPDSSGFLGEVCTAVLYAAYVSASQGGAAVAIPAVAYAEY